MSTEIIVRILVTLGADTVALLCALAIIAIAYAVRERGIVLDDVRGCAVCAGIAVVIGALAIAFIWSTNAAMDATNRMYLIVSWPHLLAGVWGWTRIAERFEAGCAHE